MYHLECYYFNLHGDLLCLSMGSEYCDGLVIVEEMGIWPLDNDQGTEEPLSHGGGSMLAVSIICH